MHLPSGEGEYCYAILDSIAGEPIRSAKSYQLRVVPWSGLGTGVPSNEVTIATRPALPESGTFCYDANEPNNSKATATPLTLAAGVDSLVLAGAIHYSLYGNVNDQDIYSLTISDLKSGELALVQVAVKPGSNFLPYPFILYTASGKKKRIDAVQVGDDLYQLVVRDNGTYDLYLLAAGFADYYGTYLVSATSGQGSWGEYAMTVKRQSGIGRDLPCPLCFEISPSAAGLGRIYLTKPVDGTPAPGGKYSRLLMPGGMPLTTPLSMKFLGEAEPGSTLMDWKGDFPGSANPFSVSFDPLHDLPGVRTLMGFFQPIPDGTFELVYSPPTPYRPILGDEKRYQGPAGTEVQITIPEGALNGFDFLGWDGEVTPNDVVSPADWERSLSIRIRLTRNMRLIPMIAPRPCTPGGIGAFTNTLHIANAAGATADLLFGMQPGAGDGLEAGQTELPPVPPPGVADFRFINIPGIQGSFFDIRAVSPAHTFLGRLQPGDNGDPVMMSWNPIPSSVPGSFFLKIGNETIDMRTRTRFAQTAGSSMTFTIVVTRDTCRLLPPGSARIASSDLDPSPFPIVRGRICLEDSLGNPYFNLRAADLSIRERDPQSGAYDAKAHLRRFAPEGNCYRFELLLNDTIPPIPANERRGVQIRIFTDEPASEQQLAVEWNVPPLDAGPDTANGNGKPHAGLPFNRGPGWHLFSLPLIVRDPSAASFFSTPYAGPLYGFDPNGGLMVREAAVFGQGYWVHFSDSVHILLNGLDKTLISLSGLPGTGQSEADGWNLIGALSRDVNVSTITQSPPGAILSIFGFDNGYKSAATLKPGEGYWVRLKPDATLGLVSLPFTGGRISRGTAFATPYDALLASLPRRREWTIRDAEGSSTSLFTLPQRTFESLSPSDLTILALPPQPPPGAFDARFVGDRAFSAEADRLEIDVQGSFPLSLRTDPDPAARWDVSTRDGIPLGSIEPASGYEAVVPPPRAGVTRSRIVLSKRAAGEEIPAGYALGQNYPNPFTAGSAGTGTRFDFSLPREESATLAIYDLFGREVRVLRHETLGAGYYSATWDGRDQAGRLLPTGLYISELRAGDTRLTKNLLIIR